MLGSFLSLTTPSVTVRRSTGTPSFSDAISTSTRRASAAALRSAAPRAPDAGRAGGAALIDGEVGVALHHADASGGRSSSSAIIMSQPISVPWPMSTLPTQPTALPSWLMLM